MAAKLDVREIPIDDLVPASWNANRVAPKTMRQIEHSIRTFGVVENLVVRALPGERGKFEVLSGNHRLRIFRKLKRARVACHVVVDDADARLLAQTLNRTRGVDDPEILEELLAFIRDRRPDDEIAKLLDGFELDPLPPAFAQFNHPGGYVKPIHPLKLGLRLEACCHLPRLGSALEAFAGFGQLTHWYARLFERVVRVDTNAEAQPDYVMPAVKYLRERLLEDGPFDLIDLDDEGCPWQELDVLFETLRGSEHPPFVLCVTDGLGYSARVHREVDLERFYRWPLKRRSDKRIFRRLPELLDHGVQVRVKEAGYRAERIAVEWKPGKHVTLGSWTITPPDERSELERLADPDPESRIFGGWRVQLP